LNILILEDDKIYASLIQFNLKKKIFAAKCDIVSSFKELKEIDKDYDLYIVDYILPDTKEDEHIEYLINQDKKVILMTQFEYKFPKKKWNDKIVDLILKDDISVINYLVNLVNRIYKNQFLKVLIIDDSSMVLRHQERILNLLNISVYKASNGVEALKVLKENEIDFVITDIEMPLMDGIELVKEIRKEKNVDELPILVLSSSNNLDKTFKILKLGANDFIKKPFEKEEFIIRVNNLLEIYDYLFEYKTSTFVDALTKTFNRRYLERNLDKLFKSYAKKSIAMVDIDFFKKINDTYGHQKGDEVLKYFSNLIKRNIRKNDILIRYGGEEFLIFMSNTSKAEGYIVLTKLKNILRDDKNKPLEFTFSAGVADEGDTLVEMIKLADERLYKAKKEGRNKIIFK